MQRALKESFHIPFKNAPFSKFKYPSCVLRLPHLGPEFFPVSSYFARSESSAMQDARDRLSAMGVGALFPAVQDWPGISSDMGVRALFPAAHDWPGISTLGRPRSGNVRWVNKENIPLGGRRRRRNGPKRSPLPTWYPRTPLRDITHIVNIVNWRNRRQQEFDNRTNAGEVEDSPIASPMTREPDDSEDTSHLHGPDSSTASDVSSVSSPSPPSLGTDTYLVDIPPLSESTMGNVDGNVAKNCFNLDAYEQIIKERMKIAIELERKKKPARSHLMLMR